MKYFVVTDVHGFYDEMIEALNKAGFDKDNQDHTFVSCGDLLDRGPKNYQCLCFVNSLPRKILVRGNHEDLLQEMLARGSSLQHDQHNGTDRTALELANASIDHEGQAGDPQLDCFELAATNRELTKYLNSLVDFHEAGKYVFVHGYVPVSVKIRGDVFDEDAVAVVDNWREASSETWSRARWDNAIDYVSLGATIPDKCIVTGHWHCNYANWLNSDSVDYDEWANPNFDPYISDAVICMDACTAYSKKVNCLPLQID